MTDLDQKAPKPKTITRYTCEGCPCLETKDWSFEGENDDQDSGTDATCTATGRAIGNYWHAHHDAPSWCPAFAALPPSPAVVTNEAPFNVFGQEAIDAAMENERTAQQFRDDLVVSPPPPALDGAGREAVIEECAKVADSWKRTADTLSARALTSRASLDHQLAADMASDIAEAIRALKETP